MTRQLSAFNRPNIMVRTVVFGTICACVASGLTGCNTFFTARAIDAFSTGLETNDLQQLKLATSDEFDGLALRRVDSMESLKVLRLPSSEFTVLDVEQVSPTQRIATVEYGTDKTRVKYKLSRAKPTGISMTPRWVVDDVILTKEQNGSTLEKSVAEQMDLLLTVQEFVSDWGNGGRTEMLSMLSPELQGRLGQLPPVFLAQLAEDVTEDMKRGKFNPEAKMMGDHAEVVLPVTGGKLMLMLDHGIGGAAVEGAIASKQRWMITSIKLKTSRRNGGETIDLADQAELLGTASRFFEAYDRADREELGLVVSESVLRDALLTANLDDVPLPTAQLLNRRPELVSHGSRTEMQFDTGTNTYVLSIVSDSVPGLVRPSGKTGKSSRYKIDEVTIYEQGGDQIKLLSSVFTAQAVMELFAEAIAPRDEAMLGQLSTPSFNQKVWKRLADPSVVQHLPLNDIPSMPPHTVTTIFQGQVTEITVRQGSKALTYILHSTSGRPQVDDVLLPATKEMPGSLRAALEPVVPVYNLAYGWSNNDKQEVERWSAEGLRRLVLMNQRTLPDLGTDVPKHLVQPLRGIRQENDETIVTLGDNVQGAEVRLTKSGTDYVVLDLSPTGQQIPGGRIDMAATVRERMRLQTLHGIESGREQQHQMAQQGPTENGIQQTLYASTNPGNHNIQQLGGAQPAANAGQGGAVLTPPQGAAPSGAAGTNYHSTVGTTYPADGGTPVRGPLQQPQATNTPRPVSIAPDARPIEQTQHSSLTDPIAIPGVGP